MTEEELKEHKHYIAIDPGINYCSIVVISPVDKFNVVESHLVNNNRAFTAEEKKLEVLYGSRAVKILNIIDKLTEVIEKYGIKYLAIEAPFYSPLTPVAYGSLLEVIFSIKYLLVLERKLKMSVIEPTAVKKLFTLKGNASKAIMKEFLFKKIEEGEIVLKLGDQDKDKDSLSEHEIDGIAVGFVYWARETSSVGV